MNRREALRLRTHRRQEFWAAMVVGIVGMILTMLVWLDLSSTP